MAAQGTWDWAAKFWPVLVETNAHSDVRVLAVFVSEFFPNVLASNEEFFLSRIYQPKASVGYDVVANRRFQRASDEKRATVRVNLRLNPKLYFVNR